MGDLENAMWRESRKPTSCSISTHSSFLTIRVSAQTTAAEVVGAPIVLIAVAVGVVLDVGANSPQHGLFHVPFVVFLQLFDDEDLGAIGHDLPQNPAPPPTFNGLV